MWIFNSEYNSRTQNMFLHYISLLYYWINNKQITLNTNHRHSHLHTQPLWHSFSTTPFMNHHSKLFNFVMLFKQGFKSSWTHLKAFMNQNSPVSRVCKALCQPSHRELNAHRVLQDCFTITAPASGSLISQCTHP